MHKTFLNIFLLYDLIIYTICKLNVKMKLFNFKDNKSHAVRVYKYIKGETMKQIKVNSEVSSDFGSYVGRLTLILKVTILVY